MKMKAEKNDDMEAKIKKSEIVKQILFAIGIIGLVIAGLALPNLALFLRNRYAPLRNINKQRIYQSLYYLKRKKIIGIGKEGDKTVVKLTENGRTKFLKYKLEDLAIKPMKKWDGRFRLVAFDIPEKFKNNRKVFQQKLKEIGFVMVQKSIWACPYQCQDEIDFLKEVYEIRPFVKLLLAEESDFKYDLMKRFNLL